MTIPFLNQGRKRDQIFAVDLGNRTTKAVLLDRKGESFSLSRYAIIDAPIYEKAMPQGLLTEHLRAIVDTIKPKTKQISLAVGGADSILRSTEMPLLPVSEMRQMLKFNSKNYLQQDLRDYVFDCYIVPPSRKKLEAPKAPGTVVKYKIWVGGARREWLTDLESAIQAAGLVPDQVTLSVLGPINALELAQPEPYAKETIAIVDLGFKASSISIVADGEICLNRAVEIGGDKFTAGLAEAMNVSYAEAEGIKVGMPQEVEAQLQPLISPLGRELRASIDFFEHQQDKTVNQVLISGGAARSEFVIQTLQAELGVPCNTWNPLATLPLSLAGDQMVEVEHVAGQLVVAVGAASMSFYKS